MSEFGFGQDQFKSGGNPDSLSDNARAGYWSAYGDALRQQHFGASGGASSSSSSATTADASSAYTLRPGGGGWVESGGGSGGGGEADSVWDRWFGGGLAYHALSSWPEYHELHWFVRFLVFPFWAAVNVVSFPVKLVLNILIAIARAVIIAAAVCICGAVLAGAIYIAIQVFSHH